MLVIGVVGFALLLIAYILSLFAVLDQESFFFNLLNFIGAALLTYYVYGYASFLITMLPATWALIALYYMFTHHENHKKNHLIETKS